MQRISSRWPNRRLNSGELMPRLWRWVRFCVLMVSLHFISVCFAQAWLGPYNTTGDTLYNERYSIADSEHDVHVLFYVQIQSNPPLGDIFHMKFSPAGDVLITPHRLLGLTRGIEAMLGLFLIGHDTLQGISLSADDRGEFFGQFRFDNHGALIDSLRPFDFVPHDLESLEGYTVSLDAQQRIHLLYSTYTLNWPVVVYARFTREGIPDIPPDTLIYAQPNFHVRMTSTVTPNGNFIGLYSNLNGSDQYMQMVIIDSTGSLVRGPFNPLPDTTHAPGAVGKIASNNIGQVVMFYGWNPPGPEISSRIDLYQFDHIGEFQNSTFVYDSLVDRDGATGFWDWDTDELNRILIAFETAELDNQGIWRKHAFTWLYDFNLTPLDTVNELPLPEIGQLSALSVVSDPAVDAVWMTAVPTWSPYARVYSWHRIVEPDCLAVADRTPSSREEDFAVLIWPNPVTSMSQVNILLPVDGAVEQRIFNILGQCIWCSTDWMPRGTTALAIGRELINLSSGHYFLRFSVGNSQRVAPIAVFK